MTFEVRSEELKLARDIARRVGSRWSLIENEDLESVLTLWLFEHDKNVTRWRDEERGWGKLFVTLKREALKYCARETAVKVGQPITRDNFYNEAMLTRALPFLFEAWPETVVRQNGNTHEPMEKPFEFNNALTIMADISGAFYGLTADIREVLEWRFRDGLTFDEIATLKSITKEGASKMVERGVKRLCDKLAGERL